MKFYIIKEAPAGTDVDSIGVIVNEKNRLYWDFFWPGTPMCNEYGVCLVYFDSVNEYLDIIEESQYIAFKKEFNSCEEALEWLTSEYFEHFL